MVLATATTGYGVGSIITDSSLITYYDPYLSQSYSGSGTTFTDLSGNTNTGTLQNSPTFNTSDFTFNGTNQEVTTSTSFISPNAYTTCVWFKTISTAGHPVFTHESSQTGTGSTSYNRKMWVGTDGLLYAAIGVSGTYKYSRSGGTVTNGVWRYASSHYDGTNLSLYINGALSVTYFNIGTADAVTGWWRVGAYKSAGWPNSSDGYFTGNIGPIQIYNRSLSSAEILQNFNAHKKLYNL